MSEEIENEEVEKKEFEDQMDDILDTLDLKSPSEEESKKVEEPEKKDEEDPKGKEGEVDDEHEDGKDKKGGVSEEEEELKEVAEIEEEKEEEGKKKEEEEEKEDIASVTDERNFLKEQNIKLMARLEMGPPLVKEEVVEPKVEDVKEVLPVPPVVPPVPEVKEFKGFLDGEDIDDIVSDPKKFEAVLGRVREQTRNDVIEHVFRAIPTLIVKQVQQQTLIKSAVDDFYKENKDLIAVKRVVGEIANDVAADNPKLTLREVFDKAAEKTRETLGLKKEAIIKEKTRRERKPALRTHIRQSKIPSDPNLSELESDVADTLELQ